MLEIRDHFGRHAHGLTSEELKQNARERDAHNKNRHPPDKAFQAARMRKRRAGKRNAPKSPRS